VDVCTSWTKVTVFRYIVSESSVRIYYIGLLYAIGLVYSFILIMYVLYSYGILSGNVRSNLNWMSSADAWNEALITDELVKRATVTRSMGGKVALCPTSPARDSHWVIHQPAEVWCSSVASRQGWSYYVRCYDVTTILFLVTQRFQSTQTLYLWANFLPTVTHGIVYHW